MIDKIKLAAVIETYLLGLHTQPNDPKRCGYGQGWKNATKELIHSIKDPDGYVSKELNLKQEITHERISEGRTKMLTEGYKATDVIFPYPEEDKLLIGEQEIKCVRKQWDTGSRIFGMKIWVDETIKDNCFYIIDRTKMETKE